MDILIRFPAALDASAWYSGYGDAALAVLAAIVLSVFRSSPPTASMNDLRDTLPMDTILVMHNNRVMKNVTITLDEEVALWARIRSLLAWRPIPIDGRVMEAAWSIQDRFRLSWWDALIVSAAQTAAAIIFFQRTFKRDRSSEAYVS